MLEHGGAVDGSNTRATQHFRATRFHSLCPRLRRNDDSRARHDIGWLGGGSYDCLVMRLLFHVCLTEWRLLINLQ
jgi:hypothetical protein